MGAGKVNYETLWRDMQYRQKRIRWRKLRPRGTDTAILMFGYPCHKDGPWFGYPEGSLADAPCSHCGQRGIFDKSDWRHHCPGHDPSGKTCPLLEDHLCKGEPSMATAPMWRSDDFVEIET